MYISRKLAAAVIILTGVMLSQALAISQQEFMDLCLKGTADEVAAALNDPEVSADKADSKGNTPLMMAASARGASADPDKIELLVRAGANPNAANRDTMRVIMHAAQGSDNPDVIAAIVAAGGDLEERSSRGWTAISFAAARNQNPKIVNTLFDLGANIDDQDNDETTPLMLAFRGGNTYAVINALLDNGADPSIQNKEKKKAVDYLDPKKFSEEEIQKLKARLEQKAEIAALTPERFMDVCRLGTQKRVSAFLTARTDPNATVNGQTPLMAAAANNYHPDVVSSLIQWGADENARDTDLRTPLIHAAISNGNPRVIDTLLLLGARADYFDVYGKTALDYASENPAFTTSDLLLLSSISKTVADAEKRGMQMEIERRASKGASEPMVPQMSELYRKSAQDQSEILRLTALNSELKARVEHAESEAQESTGKFQSLTDQIRQQKDFIDDLASRLTAREALAKKDRDLCNENIAKLTSLWQSEMQKTLTLTNEVALAKTGHRQEVSELTKLLEEEQKKSAQLKAARSEDRDLFEKEKGAMQAAFEQEKAEIREAYRTETAGLNQQIKLEREEQQRLKSIHDSEANSLQQEIIDLKAQQAKSVKDAEFRLNQEKEQLSAQYESDLNEAARISEQVRMDEIRQTTEFLKKQNAEELLLLKKRHAEYVLDLQRKLQEEQDAKIAEIIRAKDEEAEQKLRDAEAANAKLKATFDESLASLNSALAGEQENYAVLQEEYAAYRKQALESIEAAQAALRERESADQAHLNAKLAELENGLRAEFEVEKARLETEYRKTILEAIGELEAKHAEELRRLENENASKIEETSAALQAQINYARETARQESEKARAVTAESDKAIEAAQAASLKAGIEQGRSEAQSLFEAAFSQSIKQAEARNERLLKEQLAKQKVEHSADIEALNAKHRQELEKVTANADFHLQQVISEQDKRHEAELIALRQALEKQWLEREQKLKSEQEQEVDMIRSSISQNNELMISQLKEEYERRTQELLSQKEELFSEQIFKLQAAHRSALLSHNTD